MKHPDHRRDLPVDPPPDTPGSEFEPLLSEVFAPAWELPVQDLPEALARRPSLMQRVASSKAGEQGMVTVRRRRLPRQPLAEGVDVQTLYQAAAEVPLRPGEPWRARLVELQPGADLVPSAWGDTAALQACHREWLVLTGEADCNGLPLGPRDYRVDPAGWPTPRWHTSGGALLLLRESLLPAREGDAPFTVEDAAAGWPEFGPGIRRRVLWQRDGQAAFLYHTDPGAEVPIHRHDHDEECLMLQGDLFLDDVLLRPGDYQIAAAGTGHRHTRTDTGVVIYAHGDADLQFTG